MPRTASSATTKNKGIAIIGRRSNRTGGKARAAERIHTGHRSPQLQRHGLLGAGELLQLLLVRWCLELDATNHGARSSALAVHADGDGAAAKRRCSQHERAARAQNIGSGCKYYFSIAKIISKKVKANETANRENAAGKIVPQNKNAQVATTAQTQAGVLKSQMAE